MSGTIRTTRRWLLAQGATIHDEWERRLKTQDKLGVRDKRAPPYDTPNGFLKREVYRLVRRCINKQAVNLLRELVAKDDSSPRPTAYNEQDPFYWGFMFVCGMDKRVSRQDRWRFSNELQYAHKHNVPPELLVGFIYQIGKSDWLRERLRNGQMEEWWDTPERA
jgi:hypothetical protein